MDLQFHQATDISHCSAVTRAAESLPLGYSLKPEQRRSVEKFAAGSDVFVSLPTGFGKSLCYTLLPPVFDLLRGRMLRPLWNTKTLYSNSLTHLNLDSHSLSHCTSLIVFIAPSLDTPPLVWVVTRIFSVFTLVFYL